MLIGVNMEVKRITIVPALLPIVFTPRNPKMHGPIIMEK
jgi:hypothetical protein